MQIKTLATLLAASALGLGGLTSAHHVSAASHFYQTHPKHNKHPRQHLAGCTRVQTAVHLGARSVWVLPCQVADRQQAIRIHPERFD